MNFDLLELSSFCNSIEQKSASAEDRGEEDFEIRLTHDDASMLVRALHVLEEQLMLILSNK